MTFQDLATTLELSAGGLRVVFCQNKWSIQRPEDIRKFLATRFSGKKIRRVKQPWRSVAHLQKWRFVKKVRQIEDSPLTEKVRILEEKLREKNLELRTQNEKLMEKEAENKKLKIQNLENMPQPERESSPENSLIKAIEVQANVAPGKATPFGVVPSAEERRAAARARRANEKMIQKENDSIPKVEVIEENLNSDSSDSSDFSDSRSQAPPENSEQRNQRNQENQRNHGSDRVEKLLAEIAALRAEIRCRIEKLGTWNLEPETQKSGEIATPGNVAVPESRIAPEAQNTEEISAEISIETPAPAPTETPAPLPAAPAPTPTETPAPLPAPRAEAAPEVQNEEKIPTEPLPGAELPQTETAPATEENVAELPQTETAPATEENVAELPQPRQKEIPTEKTEAESAPPNEPG